MGGVKMQKTYQVTIKSTTGKYKPIACLITCEEVNLKDPTERYNLAEKGTKKICLKKCWGKTDIVKYGYTKAMVREYEQK